MGATAGMGRMVDLHVRWWLNELAVGVQVGGGTCTKCLYARLFAEFDLAGQK